MVFPTPEQNGIAVFFNTARTKNDGLVVFCKVDEECDGAVESGEEVRQVGDGF